jgi:hypothetical protein
MSVSFGSAFSIIGFGAGGAESPPPPHADKDKTASARQKKTEMIDLIFLVILSSLNTLYSLKSKRLSSSFRQTGINVKRKTEQFQNAGLQFVQRCHVTDHLARQMHSGQENFVELFQ